MDIIKTAKNLLVLFTISMVLLCPPSISAQGLEYKIKASYLEKFTRFIDWPSNIIADDTAKPFIISVLGENPFNGTLDRMYSTITIKHRPVQIRYINHIDEIKNSHLLFIAKGNKKPLAEIMSVTKKTPILLVGETTGAAKNGVHINFYKSPERTIRFEINDQAVRESGFEISYLLLRLAKIVKQ